MNDKDADSTVTMLGIERQNLHNTALSILYNSEKYNRELVLSAGLYLNNLLIAAANDLGKIISGTKQT